MPCVILLEESSQIRIIKTAWVEKVNSADSRTSGTPPNIPVKIFYSPNKQLPADFQLKPEVDFDPEQTACYTGYVLKIFGK